MKLSRLEILGYWAYALAIVSAAISAFRIDPNPLWILVGFALWVVGMVLVFTGLFWSWRKK